MRHWWSPYLLAAAAIFVGFIAFKVLVGIVGLIAKLVFFVLIAAVVYVVVRRAFASAPRRP